MLPPHFCLWQRKVDQLDIIMVLEMYQTEDQVRHIYKKVATDKVVNVETMK